MYTLAYFTEEYKKLSNSELLEILQNAAQYQAIALKAAKAEFALRNLSELELNEAKQVLLDKANEKARCHEKQEEIKHKLTGAGNMAYDTLSPFQSNLPTAIKVIRLIAVVFAIILIYGFSINFDLFVEIINGDAGKFAYPLYLFTFLVELFAVILFCFKKKPGWLLLVFVCSYSVVIDFIGLFNSIISQFEEDYFAQLLPSPPATQYIIGLLFYGGTVVALNRQDVRDVYAVSKNAVQAPAILGVLLGLFFLLLATW